MMWRYVVPIAIQYVVLTYNPVPVRNRKDGTLKTPQELFQIGTPDPVLCNFTRQVGVNRN